MAESKRVVEVPLIKWSSVALGLLVSGSVWKATLTLQDGMKVTAAAKFGWISRLEAGRAARFLLKADGAGGMPRLYGITESEPLVLLMEHRPGQTLSSYLETNPPLDRLKAFKAACEALKEVHEVGLVLGHVESDSLLVDDRSEEIKVHIAGSLGQARCLQGLPPSYQRLDVNSDAQLMRDVGRQLKKSVEESQEHKFLTSTVATVVDKLCRDLYV